MPVLVTGGTGFVGSHVVRLLVARGEAVRVLVRPGSSRAILDGIPVEFREGDLRDPESLLRAMEGCDLVFHVAADYRLWCPDPIELYLSNVGGTEHLLRAAMDQSVKRVVYTSTVGCLGNPGDGRPGTEDTPVTLREMVGHYKRSKFLAEEIAVNYAEAGCPVVIVNPSTPVGPGDWKPTPTGKIILDFLNGRMPAYVETGLNLVDVRDVAEGHLLAAEKGKIGEKYILGNQNLCLRDILRVLGEIAGKKAPRVRIPYALALAVGYAEAGRSRLLKTEPRVPLEGVRMARKKMFFSPEKAVRELGLPQTPVEEALERAVHWYSEHGYLRG